MFFHRSKYAFSDVSEVPGGFFKFMKNRDFSPHMGPKQSTWTKPFDYSVLCSYFMKINDILTKWILKTYSMLEKCVQIMYSSINNSKIHPKCTKPPNSMGRIRTASLLCTRITLETTALRVTWKLRSRQVFFQRSRCVLSSVSQVPGGFFKFMKNHDLSTRMGPKKIVHKSTFWSHRTRLIFYAN